MSKKNLGWRSFNWFLALTFFGAGIGYSNESASKEIVHSFDVFDTLVGRLHKDPHAHYYPVESLYPFPGFPAKRIQAELRSNGTLEDIYHQFALLTGISQAEAQKLRKFEFQEELSNVFPIMSTLSQVQDGDILVTDTYYSESEILQIVRKVGLDKKVKIFATVNGKKEGWVWPVILRSYTILEHIGDNEVSDVASPKRYGIRAKKFELCNYSSIENEVYKAGQEELANLMRVLRLSNPYPQDSKMYQSWWEQAQFNVPILILSSFFLNDFCQKQKIQTILFSQRDCYHWIKIFQALFPAYHSIDFMTSRLAYNNPSPEYIKDVSSLCKEKFVIADGNGSGESCVNFFKKYLQISPLNLAIVRRGSACPGITYADATYIEYINCAPFGSLKTLTSEGPVRLNLELPIGLVQAASACVNRAIQILPSFQFKGFDKTTMEEVLMKNLMKQKPVMMPYHRNTHGP